MKPSNDREAITLILEGLVAKGCTITAVADDTWNMDDITKTSDLTEAIDLVTDVDEAVVYFKLPADAERQTSHIYFVLGNDPEEVACDYGVSISPYLDPIVDPWWE